MVLGMEATKNWGFKSRNHDFWLVGYSQGDKHRDIFSRIIKWGFNPARTLVCGDIPSGKLT